MKIYRGLVDLITRPTKVKIFLIATGIISGIAIYYKAYEYKHHNHSLLGIIISTIPTIVILSLMGDVGETKKPEMVERTKENSLPMIINDRPYKHNMYGNVVQEQSTTPRPTMIEKTQIIECDRKIIRERVYF